MPSNRQLMISQGDEANVIYQVSMLYSKLLLQRLGLCPDPITNCSVPWFVLEANQRPPVLFPQQHLRFVSPYRGRSLLHQSLSRRQLYSNSSPSLCSCFVYLLLEKET
jgi:hypothetical protein